MSSEMKLVWEDNFDTGAIDGSKWTYEIGGNGWGNAELQHYTNRSENARIENNNLIIEGRREDFEGKSFTSARLITKGLMAFKYGILEARIKIPKNQKGLWPAFWTLGANIDQVQWPACGEIDILESGSAASIGENMVDRRLGAALHWAGGDKNNDHNTEWDLSEYFRTFKLTWTEFEISVSIDDVEYFKSENPDDSFKKPHYILLNLAIGGQYTGIQDPGEIDAPFPAQILI